MAASSQGVTRIIAQGANTATLLVDNVSKTVSMPSPGLILYVAFLKNATSEDVARAVDEIVNAKVFPLQSNIDMWRIAQGISPSSTAASNNERPKPLSLLECPEANVMIIPQATLAGKLKAKTVQYHGQCDKKDAEGHFYDFCRLVRSALQVSDEVDQNGVAIGVAGPRIVLNGTFGNRQGLDMSSAGPFTHIFEL